MLKDLRRPKNLCLNKGYDYEQPEQEERPRSQTAYPTPRGTRIDRTDSRQEATTLGRRTDQQLAQQLPSTTNSDRRESRIIIWDWFTSPALSSRFRR